MSAIPSLFQTLERVTTVVSNVVAGGTTYEEVFATVLSSIIAQLAVSNFGAADWGTSVKTGSGEGQIVQNPGNLLAPAVVRLPLGTGFTMTGQRINLDDVGDTVSWSAVWTSSHPGVGTVPLSSFELISTPSVYSATVFADQGKLLHDHHEYWGDPAYSMPYTDVVPSKLNAYAIVVTVTVSSEPDTSGNYAVDATYALYANGKKLDTLDPDNQAPIVNKLRSNGGSAFGFSTDNKQAIHLRPRFKVHGSSALQGSGYTTVDYSDVAFYSSGLTPQKAMALTSKGGGLVPA